MQFPIRQVIKKTVLPLGALLYSFSALAQATSNDLNPQAILKHGIEQYQGGHYNLATSTLNEFLNYDKNTMQNQQYLLPKLSVDQARFYKTLAGIKLRDQAMVGEAEKYVSEGVNKHNQQRVAYELAKYFLEENRDLNLAIYYYELAGVDNLTNDEIADSKFELGYAYFISQQFDKARNLFVGIKEIESNKYYLPANYYYGLLSYRDGKLDEALKSFKIVRNVPEYKDIIPYYEAEIYYFKGDYDKVLDYSRRYLGKTKTLFYDKEMRLLTGQTLFELKRYQEALPYLENYYENSDKIRKEELYELAFTYYQLNKFEEAIATFQPLSNIDDTIGQTSMYLLGDCYLKTGDKKGARNAFGLASEMNYNPKQKQDASFLYSKLSYEQGFDPIAVRGFRSYLEDYPNASNSPEAKSLLSALLLKSNNYKEAYDLLKDEPSKDAAAWATFQKAAVGRGLQALQDKNYSNADTYLTASLEQSQSIPLEAVAYFWKGELAYQQGNFEDAIKFTQSFLSRTKGNEAAINKISSKATVQNANVNLGYASLKTDKFSQAASAFSDVQGTTNASSDISKDAIVRQADAAFMNKDIESAGRLYDKAIASNVGDLDYARYQKALILGLQNRTSEKIELLNYIVANGKTSVKDDAMLELGTEYLNANKPKDAVGLFTRLEKKETNITTRAKAAFLKSFALQSNNQKEEAIAAYKDYIKLFPTGADRKAALSALSSLYSTTPEQYVSFLEEQKITSEVSDSTVETTFIDAADDAFADGRYQDAIIAANNYLKKYPQGVYTVQARYDLAASNDKLGNLTEGKAGYKQVLDNKWNEYSEASAQRMAAISLDEKQYAEAKKYYNLLLENSTDDTKTSTYEGMMKIAFEEQDYEATRTWADMLLAVGEASDNEKVTARLYKGKSYQKEGKLEDAKTIYQGLDKDNFGNSSAEARYEIAKILFEQKRNEAAEKAASYAAQASNNNAYWAVKNYLLLADILTDNKDYFNAKATLQSILKNSKDESLLKEAREKLEIVKSKEANKSKLSE